MQICIIGIGQLGSRVARALNGQNVTIAALYNRTENTAQELAAELECSYTSKLEDLPPDADVYILSVRDDVITDIAEQLRDHLGDDLPVVHTSGVLSQEILSPYFNRYGSWYPLNSFAGDHEINWRETPIFVNANEEEFKEILRNMARTLSAVVLDLKDSQRMPLHLAAVFINNFTNYLFRISKDIVEQHQLSFNHLLPLLKTTIHRALDEDPSKVQTGPAKRNDRKTMNRHIEFLEEHHPQYADLYRQLSEGIQKAQ